MNKLISMISAVIFLSFLGSADGLAQQSPPDNEQVYGSQLMTEQERIEHRDRMRAATTAEEREQIRAEHHEKMKVRAEERGVSLPDEPPQPGMGQGRGQGPRDGMGSGKGDRKGTRGKKKN